MEVARAFEVNGMFFPARNESWVVSTEVHTGVQARRPLQRLEMGASVAEVARAFEVNAMFFPARNETWVVSTEVHTEVQAGRPSASGNEGIGGRGGEGVRSQPECASPLAAGVPRRARRKVWSSGRPPCTS